MPAPASADDDDTNTNVAVDAGTGGGGYEADVTGVRTVGETVQGPGVPEWLRQCRYLEWTRADKDAFDASHFGSSVIDERGTGEPDEPWGAVFCNPGEQALGINPAIGLTGLLASWPLSDPPPQIVLDVLIANAYALVELPLQVGSSAPFGDADAPMITQLSTWLWVDPAVWTPRSATTPEVFGVSVTVTATPANVTFTGPDGETVDCGANLGPAYDFDVPDDEQSSPCTLTYRHSSAVGDHRLSSTITWTATYVCSAICGSGTLPDYVVTTGRDVIVAEIQAIAVPTD